MKKIILLITSFFIFANQASAQATLENTTDAYPKLSTTAATTNQDAATAAATNPDALIKVENPANMIWLKERIDQEVLRLSEVYKVQLDAYRRDEKDFFIAQDQYRNLNTLTSIEQAVTATKKVMLSRDRSLHTYLNLIRLKLIGTEGVELAYKRTVLRKLEDSITSVKSHHELLETYTSREQMNDMADRFAPLGDQGKIAATQALFLITAGEIQDVFDRTMLLKKDIYDLNASASAQLDWSAKSRALNEADKNVAKATENMSLVWETAGNKSSGELLVSSSTTFNEKLGLSYSSIFQLLSNLNELVTYE